MPNNTITSELWRMPRVLSATGLSRTMLFQLVARSAFPRPVSLGGTAAKAWRSSEVLDWINRQT